MVNQNASLAEYEDVLAALPIRATRDTMNGNHTSFFNSRTAGVAHALSHKVSAM